MRIPLSPYGIKEVVCFAGGFLLLAIAAWLFLSPWAALPPLLLFVFVISFFRNPNRRIPDGKDIHVSPADGTVTDIQETEDEAFIGGPATRIGIFLSVFNVHINRSPCAATVESRQYRKGRFRDARDPLAGPENEALTLGLNCGDHGMKVVVRQIAGAIARRIVCRVDVGSNVERGERYGMIKFGSRTEIVVPTDRIEEIAVRPGTKVRAGSTMLLKVR